MGFLDKLKKGILGTKEMADDVKGAAAKAEKKVDDAADKTKRAADKADNAVDDAAAASDELKKD
jgi:chemotaxis regulatin CheY-phosphate phosphatase CheZ